MHIGDNNQLKQVAGNRISVMFYKVSRQDENNWSGRNKTIAYRRKESECFVKTLFSNITNKLLLMFTLSYMQNCFTWWECSFVVAMYYHTRSTHFSTLHVSYRMHFLFSITCFSNNAVNAIMYTSQTRTVKCMPTELVVLFLVPQRAWCIVYRYCQFTPLTIWPPLQWWNCLTVDHIELV